MSSTEPTGAQHWASPCFLCDASSSHSLRLPAEPPRSPAPPPGASGSSPTPADFTHHVAWLWTSHPTPRPTHIPLHFQVASSLSGHTSFLWGRTAPRMYSLTPSPRGAPLVTFLVLVPFSEFITGPREPLFKCTVLALCVSICCVRIQAENWVKHKAMQIFTLLSIRMLISCLL